MKLKERVEGHQQMATGEETISALRKATEQGAFRTGRG